MKEYEEIFSLCVEWIKERRELHAELRDAKDKLRQCALSWKDINSERIDLRQALEEVEYIPPEEGFKWYCPICHYYQGDGHADNCTTGNALKGGE